MGFVIFFFSGFIYTMEPIQKKNKRQKTQINLRKVKGRKKEKTDIYDLV